MELWNNCPVCGKFFRVKIDVMEGEGTVGFVMELAIQHSPTEGVHMLLMPPPVPIRPSGKN